MYSYLALGDSYTIGEGVSAEGKFPHQTVALLRKRHIDVAEPVVIATTGWTTDELATAIRERSIQETFSFVTLLIGVNNQYRERSLENYREEFLSLLNRAIFFANGHSRRVFVLSIPDWGVTPFAEGRDRLQIARDIDAFNSAAKSIVEAHHAVWLDITDSTRHNGIHSDYLAEDGLHPSGKEYEIWAERLAPLIEASLRV
jgi:lysophospholipase L1-like esterase